jgi:hypothetical protein
MKNYLGYRYYYLMTNYLTKTYSLRLRKSTIALLTGVSFLILLLLFIPANIFKSNKVWATAIEIPVYMLTTRDNREQAEAVEGEYGYNDRYPLGDINQLFRDCPTEIAIFVHGWGNDEYKAKERLDRVKMSLENNSYDIPLIGLSWDSNTDWDPAKVTAKENGQKLAQFILDYKETCKYEQNKDVNVRLLGHSLGSRVILSALQSLHENPVWNNNTNNFKIASVHLMAAAVDNEEVSQNPLDVSSDPTNQNTVKSSYGEAIQEEVIRFYNLYNPEDNVLQTTPFSPWGDYVYQIYPYYEKDAALGQSGYQTSPNITLPNNYFQVDVQNQIKAISDADAIQDERLVCSFFGCETIVDGWDLGLCNLIDFCQVNTGDNHAGYIGFRNPTNTNLLADDGAMNRVVEQWQSR